MIDPADYPLDKVFMDEEEIGRLNPQRGDFLQLTSILHYDKEANLIVGHRHVGENEFWSAGHIPGRPLLPGVLMIETLAQLASVQVQMNFGINGELFLGFAGVDHARFRDSVEPGTDLWATGTVTHGSLHRKLFKWTGQLLKGDGRLVADLSIVSSAI